MLQLEPERNRRMTKTKSIFRIKVRAGNMNEAMMSIEEHLAVVVWSS